MSDSFVLELCFTDLVVFGMGCCRVQGFQYGGWLAFLTYLVLAITGLVEWLAVERCHRQGKLVVGRPGPPVG